MADNSKIKLSDIDVVKAYNEELDKSKELLSGMGKQHQATNKILEAIGKRTKSNTSQGAIAQKNAKDSVKLGGTILKIKQAQNKGDKLGQAIQESKLKFQRFFTKDLSKSNQALTKAFDKEKKIEKQKGKQVDLSEEIGSALSGQIPMAKELGLLFSKKAGFMKQLLATITITTTILKSFLARTKVIGEEFGSIGMQTGALKSNLIDSAGAAVRLGQDVKELADVTKELTTNFGFSNDEASALSGKILDTSLALGLSNQEGAKLIGTLINISGLSAETAEQFSESTAQLALANGAAPTIVLRDLANSSETIAKFTGMTPDNLAKAAIQANKLGLSLNDVGGIAEGLLDFQGSLNKEIEASVLLGRNVNLQKARELALNNDLQGVAVEITKQVGSEAEFNALNLIQRKALAESLNMSVEQLGKVVTNQGKIKGINDDISGSNAFEDLLGRDALDNITKIVNDFKSIGAEVTNTIGPAVSSIVGIFASLTGILAENQAALSMMVGIATVLMTKTLATAVASIFTGSFKSAKIPGLGIALALGGVAALASAVGSTKNMASAQEGGITTQEGLVNVHPQEAIVPIEKLGGMIKDAMRPVVEENKRMREQNDTLIAETRKQAGRFATAVEGLS